jgi:hypothetical protein
MPLFSGASESDLPPWLKAEYRDIAERSSAQSRAPYTGYRGERLAPIPQSIREAHQMASVKNTYLPYLEKSTNLLGKTATPFYQEYRNYLNPFTENVVEDIAKQGNRNFKQNILPALEAQFVRLGQHGSSRHEKLMRRAARDTQKEILSNQKHALMSGYQQAAQTFNADQARAVETARELGNLSALRQAGHLSDVAALEGRGRYEQQQDQAARELAYQDFLRQQNYPMEAIERQAALLHGIPAPTQNMNYYQTPASPQLNVLGQLGNLATNVYAARMMQPR